MEVVENQHPTRPQEACGVRRGVIRPLAATPSIQDQEVERPVPLDQAPVTMKHRHVGKVGKERQASGGPCGIDLGNASLAPSVFPDPLA